MNLYIVTDGNEVLQAYASLESAKQSIKLTFPQRVINFEQHDSYMECIVSSGDTFRIYQEVLNMKPSHLWGMI